MLLSTMTNQEKNAQLGYGTGVVHGGGKNASAVVEAGRVRGGIGGIGCELAAGQCATWAQAVNLGLNSSTRLGIPAMIMCETAHSGGLSGTTLFPMPAVTGASWNVSLAEAVAREKGLQARAGGCSQALSPVVQVATDPRWGRLSENFGEDPYLVSAFGLAELAGLQGRGPRSFGPAANSSLYLDDPAGHPFAQAKHFAAYGAFPKDSYTASAGLSERTVYEVYLQPWREMVANGLRGVMVSHNALFGQPMHGNRDMISGMLRQRFGLGDGGYVGSDATNVPGLVDYGVAADAADAAALWLTAGGDQAMLDLCPGMASPNGSAPSTPSESPCNAARLVETGALPQVVLDRAAGNVLRTKFATGLFDGVGTPPTAVIDSPAARALARRVAEEGTVLLQNNGILPLKHNISVAVLGSLGGCPAANESATPPFPFCEAKCGQVGDYATGYGTYGFPTLKVITVEAGLRAAGIDVQYIRGASPTEAAQPAELRAATVAAAAADAVVLVVGDSSAGDSRVLEATGGENCDRVGLTLPGGQSSLLQTLLDDPEMTKKLIVVHIGDRPMTFPNNSAAAARIPAILTAMRPGEEGGTALARLLIGAVSPSGKLTTTWVRSVGYIGSAVQPHWQFHQINPGSWVDGPNMALFPFGHGLTYTTFQFAPPEVTIASGSHAEAVTVTVTVHNVGAIAASVVVQAYCRYHEAPKLRVLRYAQVLCGFVKRLIRPGASVKVKVPLALRALARWDPYRPAPSSTLSSAAAESAPTSRGAYIVDAGKWMVAIGDCSGAGAAIGLHNAVQCAQRNASFTLSRDWVF